jgi:hypothetical protein
MALYRHNRTGKYFVILQSELEARQKQPDSGDDFILPLKRELSENAGIASQNANDEFKIPVEYSEGSIGGGSEPISKVSELQDTFLKSINSNDAKLNFDNVSNSGQLSNIKIKKTKIKINPTELSISDLINDIETNGQESKISVAVSKLLEENNLNSPSKPFFVSQTTKEDDIVLGTIQYKDLGNHGPRKFPETVQSSKEKDQLKIKDLKQLGVNILLAASGESPISFGMANSIAGVEAANLLPSLTELGSKVNFGSMKPTKLLEQIKPGYKNQDNNDAFIDNSNQVDSFGSPNNPLKPFSGSGSPISAAKSFATLVTISFLLKKIALSLNMTGRGLGDHMENGSSRDRQKFLGSAFGNAGADLEQLALDPFELPQLTNDFFLSIDAGFKQFFGLGDDLASNIAGTAALSSAKQYGYYSIFVRKLNMAIQELILGGISTVVQNSNTGQNAETRLGLLSPEALMEKLKSNFALKFIKILALIGDKVLTTQLMQQQVPVPGLEGIVSDIDGVPEKISSTDTRVNPGILVVKHRLDSKDGMHAYGTSTHESMFLMPQSVIDADLALNRENAPYEKAVGELSKTNKIITNDYVNGRIPQDEVKKMEDYLERDYMPFYFHDLRTNEIISFHAFLDSASDSLQAEYNEVEGYGRVGVVPIYKNTKRSISFSFKVLAVNDADHDQMWFKLNRLAACLHPQFSEGRILDYRGNKFVQPFSQVFAASPLIRLRLGDLWKSNYSKLAVARLFGLSGTIAGREETFKLADTQQVSVRNPNTRIREQQQQRNASAAAPRALQVGDRVQIIPTSNKNRWPVVTLATSASARGQQLGQQIGQYRTVPGLFLYVPTGYVEGEIVEIHPTTRGTYTSTHTNYLVRVLNPRMGRSGQQTGFRMVAGNIRNRSSVASALYPVGDDPTGDIVCVNPSRLSRIQPTPEAVEAPDPIVEERRINNSITDFFRCDGNDPNPIMKAFCSTEGKGLACVIRSMALEGIMDVPWTVDKFDSRTPQLITVNMEVTPIYDVAPGLDHKGAMTAPVWPSGKIVTNLMGNLHSSEQGNENFNQSRIAYNFPSVRGPNK